MSNKATLLVLAAIFFIAFFLRIVFLKDKSLTFGYDQARDAVYSQSILAGDFKILGPPSSAPGLYHGVLYYYVLAPGYLLGKGNPITAAMWIAILNASTIVPVFLLSYFFVKKRIAGFLAALFFAFSFESTQYATWLSNPTIAILFVPLMYLFLWKWVNNRKKSLLWAFLCALAFGFSVQSEVFLAYHTLPILIWLYIRRNNISRKQIIVFIGALTLSLSTMILSEIKFGFRGISGLLSIVNTSDALVAGKGVGDVAVLFVNQIGKVFAFSTYPKNLTYGFAVCVFCLYFLHKTRAKEKNGWFYFLATWLFSHISVVSLGGVSTPFLLVGIGPAVSILLGIAIAKVFEINRWAAIIVTVVLLSANLSMIMKENPKGSTIFSIQKDMILSKQMSAIDYTYQKSEGKSFSINSVTSPLWINIVWAYLYEHYGYEKYGYLPSFHGRDQIGQVIALEQKSQNRRFLIIEPQDGIPPQYLPITIDEENASGKFLEEKYFGSMRVQYREKHE